MKGSIWFIVIAWIISFLSFLFFPLTYPFGDFRQQVWSLISEGQ
jgi:hypothetical protein